MSRSNNQSPLGGDIVYWLIALGLIAMGISAPIGVLMIVLKLLGGTKRRSGRARYEHSPIGARTAVWEPVPSKAVPPKAASSAPAAPAPPKGRTKKSAAQSGLAAQERKSTQLLTVGGVLTALFGLGLPSALEDVFFALSSGSLGLAVGEFFNAVPFLCFLGAGVGCLLAGLRKRKQVRRFRTYLNMVGRQASISVSALASATGLPPVRVRDDLADMVDCGLFPKGFLDYGSDRLILSGDGLLETPPAPKEQAPSAAPSQDSPEEAILAEIREVNEIVDNKRLSAQIDRIGVITAKILDYQRVHPEKAPQLHRFLSYYLPTTLKILRAYGQLEDQDIQGENITAAMQRIEGMMDKVVESFEKQLDLLFQGDAMDITADVEVLERMLDQDGLSGGDGMTLRL